MRKVAEAILEVESYAGGDQELLDQAHAVQLNLLVDRPRLEGKRDNGYYTERSIGSAAHEILFGLTAGHHADSRPGS